MIDLCREIRAHVTDAVKNMRLKHPSGEDRAPVVVNGFLPPKKRERDSEDDAPFIIVRPVEGSDADNGGMASVAIIFATYSAEDVDGIDEVLQVLWRVRNSLLEKRMLANRYELRLPLDWRVYEEQPHPYWYAAMVTRWVVAQPERIMEVGVYGDDTY